MDAHKASLVICGLESCTEEQREAINEALAQAKEDYGIEVTELKDMIEPADPLQVERDKASWHNYDCLPRMQSAVTYPTSSPKEFGMKYAGSSKSRHNKRRRK